MKYAVLFASLVVTWIVNAWYFLILMGVVHSWWPFVPPMGWHTSVIISGLFVIAVVVGKFIGSFTVEIIKSLK